MHHVITTPYPLHSHPKNGHQLSPSPPPSDHSLRYAVPRRHQRMPSPHHGTQTTSPSHPPKNMAPTRQGVTITDKTLEMIYLLGISTIQQQMAPISNHQPSPNLHSSATNRTPIPHDTPLHSTKVVSTSPLSLQTKMHRHRTLESILISSPTHHRLRRQPATNGWDVRMENHDRQTSDPISRSGTRGRSH